jgi:spore coat polysaccharide biosynthesis protein SpsF
LKTAVCLQVRLDSSRLPEKALIKIKDLTIIEHAMRALKEIKADQFLLLTTEDCINHLRKLAESWGFTLFSGPKDDVLKRFILAAEKYGIDTIIRATGDNPLVSSEIANKVLEEHKQLAVDYSNWYNAPLGTGVEVVQVQALKRAEKESEKNYDHEHVTPWIYNNSDIFTLNIKQVPKEYIWDSKVSVDTEEDLIKMKKIFKDLYQNKPIRVLDLIHYLKQEKKSE